MKNFIIILTGLIILVSCKKTLEEHPKSPAVENFYRTPDEFAAAVNSIYVPLHSGDGLGGVYMAMLESSVDYEYGRGTYGFLSEFQGLDVGNVTRAGKIYESFYLAIRNANIILMNAKDNEFLTPEELKPFVAEAHFLRALTYFYLVRNFGSSVIRTENNLDSISIAKSSIDEVYALIESDLLSAETDLPDKPTNIGRPTLWAAKTVLADVYLWEAKYEKASVKANEVINSGKYTLVPVETADDFINIYGPDVLTTSEEIFYLKFTRQGSGNGFFFVMFPHFPGNKYHGAGGYYAQYTDSEANPVYKNWDDKDFRKSYNWYSYDIGLGANSMLNKKFIDPQASNNYGAGNDNPLYRYADLLLIYAEAAARTAGLPTAAAMESLNEVHRRAYGKDPLKVSEVDFSLGDYNLNSFLDLVLKERGYETQYEGKRWLDLKRTGRAAEIIKETTGKDIAQKHYLWPIPISELDYNESLDPRTDQNPGY